MTLIARLVEAHQFFCHKSQWYVLGGWYEYEKNEAKRRAFRLGFPRAYLRFMYFTLKDAL